MASTRMSCSVGGSSAADATPSGRAPCEAFCSRRLESCVFSHVEFRIPDVRVASVQAYLDLLVWLTKLNLDAIDKETFR